MCGIIGYVGSKSCVPILFDGLKRLEYRGYDSTGIAVLGKDRKISLVKSEGKLSALEPLLKTLPKATIGIGHTRWATHGLPLTKNAHPHVREGLALVHNGIIENYKDFKVGLEAAGIGFQSETDTEVVLHLLAGEQDKKPLDAILSLVKKLKGAFSLGILNPQEPDALYVVKQGSPIVVGLAEGANYFCSDVSALVNATNKAIFLEDGEIVKIKADGVCFWDFDGNPIEKEIKELSWNKESAEKQGFPHYMLKEVHEQPHVMRAMIETFFKSESVNIEKTGLAKIDFSKVKQIDIVACGTAYLSSLIGKYLFEKWTRIPTNVELASEFRYRDPVVDGSHLVIAVSQSGETMDTLEALKYGKEKGAQTFSLCNVEYSSITRVSDSGLLMGAGPEIGVASTKAFTSMILSQYILAMSGSQILKRDGVFDFQKLKELPLKIEQILSNESVFKYLAEKYFNTSSFLFIGRGLHYPLAYEGALKLKEISYIHAEGYGAGELKHGPIALIDQNMPVFALCPKDEYYPKVVSNIEQVVARKGKVISVATESDAQLEEICEDVIYIPGSVDPAVQSILSSIPLQLFSYHVALRRGTDVDQPRNLAKSVTVE